MAQNYLSGSESPQINAFLTATGWNLKKMMKQLKEELENLSETFLNRVLTLLLIDHKWLYSRATR